MTTQAHEPRHQLHRPRQYTAPIPASVTTTVPTSGPPRDASRLAAAACNFTGPPGNAKAPCNPLSGSAPGKSSAAMGNCALKSPSNLTSALCGNSRRQGMQVLAQAARSLTACSKAQPACFPLQQD